MHATPADLATRLTAAREILLGAASDLTSFGSGELPDLAAHAAGVVAAARAFQAAVVLEAEQRGVIASSDHPKVTAWVEQSCRDAGVPVVPAQTRALGDVAKTCTSPDVAALRDAVVQGQASVESAAKIAAIYRRMRPRVDVDCWDTVIDELIGWTAQGAPARELASFEDALLGQYGTATALEDEHDQLVQQRAFTAPVKNRRTGMLEARVVMDPVSEAVITAAINALSVPKPDPETGEHDPRTPGARRLDALVTMARHAATTPDKEIRGTGLSARVVVTISLTDLLTGLASSTLGAQLGFGSTQEGMGDSAELGAFAADTRPSRPGGGYGHTNFGQVLFPETVRMLACDAQIIPAVLGAKGEVQDWGHAKRLVPPGLATGIELRDKHCTYPGCRIPPGWCDKHHVHYWANGGRTSYDNCVCLCRHHHTVVHRFGHTATVTPGGVRWFRAEGTPIGNQPRGEPPPRPPGDPLTSAA